MRGDTTQRRSTDVQPPRAGGGDLTGGDPAGIGRARWLRFERSVAAATGGLFLVAGSWAFFAPVSFFDAAATFDPYNVHLIRDIGAFQIGIGAVLILALLVRDALLTALAGAGAGATFHFVGHLIDHDLGGNPVVDFPVFGLTVALLLVAALARGWQVTRRS